MKCYVLFYVLTVLMLELSHCNNESYVEKLKSKCGLQGNAFSITHLPWVAYMHLLTRTYNPNADVRCVGALINERYVITSSSCLQFVVKQVNIGQSKIDVNSWMAHENADIALLKLATSVNFSDSVQPICLPFDELNNSERKITFYTPGWGDTDEEPKIVKNKVVDCQDDNNNTMCLNNVGKNHVCNGDEGSPVMYVDDDKWVLHGVLSSTFDKDGSPCAKKNPSIAIKIVDEVLNWIVEKIEL